MSQANKVTKSFGSVSSTGSDVQMLSGSGALGAVSLSKQVSLIVTSGAATGTLAAGKVGQIKIISMVTDGGDFVLTPNSVAGGTTVTFNDASDCIKLVYTGAKWNVISNNGCTIA